MCNYGAEKKCVVAKVDCMSWKLHELEVGWKLIEKTTGWIKRENDKERQKMTGKDKETGNDE